MSKLMNLILLFSQRKQLILLWSRIKTQRNMNLVIDVAEHPVIGRMWICAAGNQNRPRIKQEITGT